MWLDDVSCQGDEARLADCASRPLGSHNCGHGEDVSVQCIVQPGEQCRIDAHCDGDDVCAGGACAPPPAVCGDGNLDAGEECDDGNVVDGDGCSAQCAVEAPQPPGFAGQFRVNDGPRWDAAGTVAVSCLAACAQLFGGAAADYACSTVEGVINNRAFVDGWGDQQFCQGEGVAEDFVQPGEGQPYNCGANACSYSAYVNDHECASVNYCWRLAGVPPAQ
ncbi:MAG: hypothetical protein H6702_23970 [Myxococcales bacterium]|nr:hypothetical protein [Myxococcales bacterium]